MQLYEVGGAVRDALLGLPASDRDWVAVGATPDELITLGYRPVGRDFPVFLHPETGEEVALARTERKSGRGYHGFAFHAAPEVTLEEDLARRDLTINAMARAPDGRLIDPYGGARDLEAGVLRHVSPAFAEDPVRLLRLARFAARFHRFTIAPETLLLLRQLVQAGEVDALVAERVWQELARGLMEVRPSRMFTVLDDCGALPRLAPGLDADAERLSWLDRAAEQGLQLPQRFALLMLGVPAAAAIGERWRVPADCSALARLLNDEAGALADPGALDASATVALLGRGDAWRRPQRFDALLGAAQCRWAVSYDALQKTWRAAAAVDTAAVAAGAAARGATGPALAEAIRSARIDAAARGGA